MADNKPPAAGTSGKAGPTPPSAKPAAPAPAAPAPAVPAAAKPGAATPPSAPAKPAAPTPAAPTLAAAAPANADEAARKEVLRLLRGPVAQLYKTLIPALASIEDPYKAVMSNHELLDACFKLYQAKRETFAAFLVDAKGAAVPDDSVRLVCGRSVNEVIGMAVRSGMRAYAERHFTGVAAAAGAAAQTPRGRWIVTIASMFRKKQAASGPKAKDGKDATQRFYNAIRDALDFAWQVQFFPIYVEIPATLFEKLGIGITRMDSVEKLQGLAQLGGEDIGKAEQVVADQTLAKEMIENNVLAAAAVSQMSASDFKTVHDALAGLDVRKKWDVFANSVTALQLASDKRISKADIAALAQHLDILNEFALKVIIDLKLARDQIGNFLSTSEKALGRAVFMALFGPLPVVNAEDNAAGAQLKSYTGYIQTTLRALVQAVQQLEAKFKRDDPGVIAECMTLVCESRRDGIAAEVKKLQPAMA